MTIPLVNLRRQHEELYDEIHDAIDDVLTHGDFVLGGAVDAATDLKPRVGTVAGAAGFPRPSMDIRP